MRPLTSHPTNHPKQDMVGTGVEVKITHKWLPLMEFHIWMYQGWPTNLHKSVLSSCFQRYIKSKEEQHILQLMSWSAQSVDLNPIELVGYELVRKGRAKQLFHVAYLWLFLLESWEEISSVFFQFFGWKNPKNLWSSDSGQRSHFDESKVCEVFCVCMV